MPLSLSLQPIGFIRTPKQVKFQALHQPAEAQPETNVLELSPVDGYREALHDLAGFSRIWLLWWFHRNTGWRPMVLPPRGPAQRRGVFATRSPHRPNALGLTPVQLLRIEGLRLILGPCDLVDGTPVFDIKPYVPAYDAFPGERAGWIEEVDTAFRSPPEYSVKFSARAEEQAAWLVDAWSIDFRPRLIEILERDPTPHRTRRIRRRDGVTFEIGCGAWRAFFSLAEKEITVVSLDAAYPLRFLNDPQLADIPDGAAQIAFLQKWPGSTKT